MNFHDRYHQNNNNFTEKMAANFSKTIDAIINHPYISALEKKQINKEKLEVFVCEQYHIIANDRKNFAFIISKASDEISTDLFFDCLSAEVQALKNHSCSTCLYDANSVYAPDSSHIARKPLCEHICECYSIGLAYYYCYFSSCLSSFQE